MGVKIQPILVRVAYSGLTDADKIFQTHCNIFFSFSFFHKFYIVVTSCDRHSIYWALTISHAGREPGEVHPGLPNEGCFCYLFQGKQQNSGMKSVGKCGRKDCR